MTFPKKLEDEPAHKLGQYPGDGEKVYYSDDIYVGYRYYDTYKVEPQFPFGHGLSYTSFSYSNLKLEQKGAAVTVSFTLKNTGKTIGAEVPQVYVKQSQSLLPRPEKELKGFSKVSLQPGQEKVVSIILGKDAFSYFNDIKNEWVSEPGQFQIMVGGSSRSLPLSGNIKL